jgi:hypothetical protein
VTRTLLVKKSAGSILLSLLLVLSGCSTTLDTSDNISPAAEPALIVALPAEVVIDKSKLRARIAAVGDIMLGTDYPQNTLPDDDGLSFLNGVRANLQFGRRAARWWRTRKDLQQSQCLLSV